MSESLIVVKKLLSDENIESLGQILANVEAITATVADESDNIQSVIREAEGLLSSANAAVDVFAEFSSSVSL